MSNTPLVLRELVTHPKSACIDNGRWIAERPGAWASWFRLYAADRAEDWRDARATLNIDARYLKKRCKRVYLNAKTAILAACNSASGTNRVDPGLDADADAKKPLLN
jgi:hypothetical protein